jgi:hypothetical protein
MNQDNSVGIAMRYFIYGRDSTPGKGNRFHSVQTGSEVHPVSHPIGTGECFPEGKVVGVYVPLTTFRGQKWWSYTSTFNTFSWNGA